MSRFSEPLKHRIPSFYKTKCVFPPGATAFIVAAKEGHLDIVRFLVEADAAKDQADNTGVRAMFMAAQNGLLVEANAAKD